MEGPNNKGIPCGDPYDKDSIADWDLYGGPPILGNCHSLKRVTNSNKFRGHVLSLVSEVRRLRNSPGLWGSSAYGFNVVKGVYKLPSLKVT